MACWPNSKMTLGRLHAVPTFRHFRVLNLVGIFGTTFAEMCALPLALEALKPGAKLCIEPTVRSSRLTNLACRQSSYACWVLIAWAASCVMVRVGTSVLSQWSVLQIGMSCGCEMTWFGKPAADTSSRQPSSTASTGTRSGVPRACRVSSSAHRPSPPEATPMLCASTPDSLLSTPHEAHCQPPTFI